MGHQPSWDGLVPFSSWLRRSGMRKGHRVDNGSDVCDPRPALVIPVWTDTNVYMQATKVVGYVLHRPGHLTHMEAWYPYTAASSLLQDHGFTTVGGARACVERYFEQGFRTVG